jgi:D-aminopeptidase
VNLANVSNGHTLTVELDNVVDTFGGTGNVSVPVGFLIGDTNKDGFVDSIDTAQTKSQAGNALSTTNFREDVNVDGFIDAIDVALVKSKSGTVLNAAPPSGTAAPQRH